jgi:hypothetical protein
VCGALLSVQLATACGGSEFNGEAAASAGAAGATQSGAGNGAAGTSQAGKGGSSSGGSTLAGCHGPEDCSDGDACTNDVCQHNGECASVARCPADQKCCDGDCGECCDDGDCDDKVGCTDDQCFAGVCMHLPNPDSCGAGKYCSLQDDCVDQEACDAGGSAACDDKSACTSDACEDSLCVHTFCDDATRCCPDSGCAAECCTNQECDTDSDACTVGVCTAGKCSQAARCGDGEKCCPAADGSASCGACCSADDCSDNVICTVDACIEGRCYSAAGVCDQGYTCDPQAGCKKDIECKEDADCSSEGCGRCNDGTCEYGCDAGQVCCNNSCQGCCTAADCYDGIACTDNFCVENQCQFKPNNKLCPVLQQCLVAKRGCALL